ncbi:MAG: CBS domain-containing protein [Carnobacterium sp.]|uniref:CBS domain-containing protein n=1 Tax=Carnobacterium sp. TaxID=48221 RepID=UPI0033157F69
MNNAERFIASFNRIHNFLSFSDNEKEYKQPFYRLLDENEYRNPAVKKYKNDLQIFADLRNVMVHKKLIPNSYIAQPTDNVVKHIEQIEEEIKSPERVYPLFKRDVVQFNFDDLFTKVLTTISERKFTHFPVYKNKKLIGLLTEKGITMWLASQLEDETIYLKKTMVEEIISEDTRRNNYLFIKKSMSIEVAADLLKNDRRLDALLITENGNVSELPLGIITPSDL